MKDRIDATFNIELFLLNQTFLKQKIIKTTSIFAIYNYIQALLELNSPPHQAIFKKVFKMSDFPCLFDGLDRILEN